MRKNLVLLPQTLGPFMGKPAKAMARYILRRAGLAYSRDYPGLQETREFMGPKIHAERLKFCYDLGFVVDPLPPEKLNLDGFCERKKTAGCVAGFNVSGLLFMGGYSRNNMFGLKADYQKLVYAILELLMQKPEAAVVLVPHVFGAATLQESDASVCEKIYDELKTQYKNRLFFARGGYNQNEIKHIIGFCDFFIGSRMHACIAALSQNIPAVAIAYSKKFWGVMQTIGVEALVADPREMENAAILRHVDEAYERRGEWRAQLQHTVPQVKATVLNLFADIAESENHQRPTSR
jgi:polysaccharide pyruvyl transferase WcaK-like protein